MWADSLESPIFIKVRKVLLWLENILVFFIQAELSGLSWVVCFYPRFASDEGVQGTLKSSLRVSGADTPSRTVLNPSLYFNWESSSSLYTGKHRHNSHVLDAFGKKKKYSFFFFLYILLLLFYSNLRAFVRWPRENFSDPGSLWSALGCDFSLLSFRWGENSFICFLEILPEVWSSHDILFYFLSTAVFSEIYLFCHFIKLLARKGRSWVYLISHMNLEAPYFEQIFVKNCLFVLHMIIWEIKEEFQY